MSEIGDQLDPQEAAQMFFAGHPLAYVSSPDDRFVCGQWMGQLAYITPIPFDNAEQYFTDNPVILASRDPFPAPPPVVLPPVVVDAPYVQQTGELLTCTMGNWQNEPSAYSYQWRSDGEDVGADGGAQYVVTSDDIGATFDCVLTASNEAGSATSTSNSVVVAAPSRSK